MTTKAKPATNSRLVIWLPSILMAMAALWWVAGSFLATHFDYLFWVDLIVEAILLTGVIATSIQALRQHEKLHQPAWLHLLNMLWLALAVLGAMGVLGILYFAATWPI